MRRADVQTAASATHRVRDEGLQWWVVYLILLPLFAVTEGARRLASRFTVEENGSALPRGSWRAEARSQASIATSYALMARSMLQSSERRTRPERPS
jgi:hypothetical protein